MDQKEEWFGEWFNSPYYHILYKNRDYHEAQLFIDNLITYLKLAKSDKILDLACGKGRHAIYLHKRGYEVVGIDYSPQNIEFAQRFSRIYGKGRLKFYVHDMREVFQVEMFDYVLNIFTSFGYFENPGENLKAIMAAATSLKKGGCMVIDFFNTTKVLTTLVPFEEKELEGVRFSIERVVENGFIVKRIKVVDKEKQFSFQEKVKAINKEDFFKYFKSAKLYVKDFFGDYILSPYNPDSSDRMIFVLQKNKF